MSAGPHLELGGVVYGLFRDNAVLEVLGVAAQVDIETKDWKASSYVSFKR
jgi:hypothetical protein